MYSLDPVSIYNNLKYFPVSGDKFLAESRVSIKDFTKAIEWYRVSAKLGYPDADLWLKEKGF